MKKHHLILWMCAVSVLVVAVALAAAPFRPQSPGLTPEARSLAGIMELRVDISDPPDELVEAGFDAEVVKGQWHEALRDRGFKVLDEVEDDTADEDVPKVTLYFVAAKHSGQSDVASVAAMVRLRQAVTIGRTGDETFVTTYLDHVMFVKSQEELGETLEFAQQALLKRFMNQVKRATKWQEEGGG